ncbi:MAG: hypothetical protein PQJ60_08305 [Spirochaetales bacterium]|nr:hypothetical protein [Spirochaetales bacterium]
MEFCTVINCMDGRTQLPVIHFALNRFQAKYADSLTEAGPNRILAEEAPQELIRSLMNRLDISLKNHGSEGIVIAGHQDCAGNPTSDRMQQEQLLKAAQVLARHFPQTEIVPVWVELKEGEWRASELKE